MAAAISTRHLADYLTQPGDDCVIIDGFRHRAVDIRLGPDINFPLRDPAHLLKVGRAWSLVWGVLITIVALLFSLPLALGAAIYVSQLARPRVRELVKPVIELLAGIPAHSIKTIALTALKKDELISNLLGECKRLLGNISKDLKLNAYRNAAQYQDLFTWISETIQTINKLAYFQLVEVKLLLSTIRQIQEYLKSDEKDAGKTVSLAGVIESMMSYLDAIQLKILTDFSVSAEELSQAIDDSEALLPEIAEAFQIGRDKDAFEKINKIINILELCCIYLRKNLAAFSESERLEIDNLYEEINSLLTQIVDAFESGDAVMLGDLLEYELPGKLENYKNIVLE